MRVDYMRITQFSAYHGTKKSYANKIVEIKEFLPNTTRDDHWLGEGSYFFKEDFEQAMMWARYRYKKFTGKEGDRPAVVEVLVQAPEDKVLNLDSRGGIEFLDKYIRHLADEKNLDLRAFDDTLNKATLACFVFSSIDKDFKWVINRTFPVPSVYDKSAELDRLRFKHQDELISYGLQGAQVCVKNKEAIDASSIRSHSEKDIIGNISVIPTKKETISDELFR